MIQCMRKYIFEMEELKMNTNELDAVNKLLEKIPEDELKAAGGALRPDQIAMLKKIGILGALFAGGVGVGVAGTFGVQALMNRNKKTPSANVGGAGAIAEEAITDWNKAVDKYNSHPANTPWTQEEIMELGKLFPEKASFEAGTKFLNDRGITGFKFVKDEDENAEYSFKVVPV